jgi:predicted solute-binding protein
VSPSLRIGAVPYLNARPLVEGLAADPRVAYREDVPSALAAELAAGRLDCALASSIEAVRRDGAGGAAARASCPGSASRARGRCGR